jgi:hypothetical protein
MPVEGCAHGSTPTSSARTWSSYLASRLSRTSRSASATGARSSSQSSTLSRFRPLRKAIGVDLYRPAGLVRYARSRQKVTVVAADSQSESFQHFVSAEGPFDLVLIDGDHSEAGCRRDFQTVADHARILAFHDITSDVPGVTAVWREVRQTHADRFGFVEFTDQYPELVRPGESYFGIGVAVKRGSRS